MIFIALRQLWARKRQTILTLLGVMLGAAAYIAISGILLGFRNYLLDQMVNNDAHVRISAKARLIEENSFDHVFTQPQEKLFWIVPPSGRKDADKIDNVQEWIQRLRADNGRVSTMRTWSPIETPSISLCAINLVRRRT